MRPPGWYWAKEFVEEEWQVAYWNGHCWCVALNGYSNDLFEMVGPRIKDPDEVKI